MNINKKNKKHGLTPLHCAAREGYMSIVNYMCEQCRKVDINVDINASLISDVKKCGHTAVACYLEAVMVRAMAQMVMRMEKSILPCCMEVRKIIYKYL